MPKVASWKRNCGTLWFKLFVKYQVLIAGLHFMPRLSFICDLIAYIFVEDKWRVWKWQVTKRYVTPNVTNWPCSDDLITLAQGGGEILGHNQICHKTATHPDLLIHLQCDTCLTTHTHHSGTRWVWSENVNVKVPNPIFQNFIFCFI